MVPNQGNLSEQGYTLIKSFRGKVTQDGRAVGLRQHPSHGLVVTKTIDEHSTEAENEDEVPNEVRVLKSLPPHHRIVKLIAELPDSPYQGAFTSVLGFCNGGDVRELELYARATGNQMPEPWFWYFFIQLARALNHCHHHGFAHGDFHGGNWLINIRPDSSGYVGHDTLDIIVTDFEYGGPPTRGSAYFDVTVLGDELHASLYYRDGKPRQNWSSEFIHWINRCRHAAAIKLTSAQLCEEMIPVAEAMIAKAAQPLVLPDWAVQYFNDKRASIAAVQQDALDHPLDEAVEWALDEIGRVPSTRLRIPSDASHSSYPDLHFVIWLRKRYHLSNDAEYLALPNFGAQLRFIRGKVEAELMVLMTPGRAATEGKDRKRIENAGKWMARIGRMAEELREVDWDEFLLAAEGFVVPNGRSIPH